MAMQVCTKITSKLQFLHRKNRSLLKYLRRLLCNTLIQSHFDYACATWYPNLNKKYRNKLQILQNKIYTFLLKIGQQRAHRIWTFWQDKPLRTDQRFPQCVSSSVFIFFFEICPQYMNKIYKTSSQNNIVTRSFSLKLSQPLRTKALTQKSLPYLGQLIWNGLPDDIKLSNNANMLKDKVKRNLLALLQEKDQDIYIYHG